MATNLKGKKHECNAVLDDGTVVESGNHGKRAGACSGLSSDLQSYFLQNGESVTSWENYQDSTCSIILVDNSTSGYIYPKVTCD